VAIAVAVIAAAAIIAAVLMLMRDDPRSAPSARAPAPLTGSSSTVDATPARAVDARRPYPQRTPFVVAGVRFSVAAQPNQAWARQVRATDPGAGKRWALVSVIYRNVSRERLLAEDLRFRARSASGSLHEPAAAAGNGGSNLPAGTQIFRGTLVRGELAFKVAAEEEDMTLLIDPSAKTRIRVELGAG